MDLDLSLISYHAGVKVILLVVADSLGNHNYQLNAIYH